MFSLSTFRTQLSTILHLQESPHRTALAFAIGVFIAFAPHYGLHTVSVVLCAWAFRLNYLVVFLGSLINNPWTIIPILGGSLYTGFALFGIPPTVSSVWQDIQIENLYDIISQYLVPFIAGACILGMLGALLAYPTMLYTIRRYRAIKAK
jgi:uncharacterized protein (DUF2062 family)